MRLIKVFSLLFFPLPLFAQDLQFYKEDLTFTLRDSSFKVDGLYYFCNVGENKYLSEIYYPFPVDSVFYGAIDSIQVEMDNVLLPFRQNSNMGISIPLSLYPYKSIVYRISYRQKLLKNKALYILTTTQMWKRPLERVTYHLNTPNTIQVKSFSYPFDSIRSYGDSTHYSWDKNDFFPTKDFLIEFAYKNQNFNL